MVNFIGVNHVAMVVNDITEALRLYRDTLGLEVVSTIGAVKGRAVSSARSEYANSANRLYNFDIGGGSLLTIIELPEAEITGRSSFAYELWPGDHPLTPLGGVDHFAFNVESEADLVEIRQRLLRAGYEVSELSQLVRYPYWKQLRFRDSVGNSLEVTTWDYGDEAWARRTITDSERFEDPVPD